MNSARSAIAAHRSRKPSRPIDSEQARSMISASALVAMHERLLPSPLTKAERWPHKLDSRVRPRPARNRDADRVASFRNLLPKIGEPAQALPSTIHTERSSSEPHSKFPSTPNCHRSRNS